ncbi:hypothetical protein JTB14_023773 [Gonioctena quinquepunctata]|nr:hypothetical protein JTB14_023773 [Gonioctena quinquepunctata]
MDIMVKSFVFVFLAACLGVGQSGASLCKPLSSFFMDCNTCTCSENGMEYSCSDYVCPPKPKSYKEKYDVKVTKDGHQVLVPKSSDQYVFDDDNNFVITKKHRVPRQQAGYPYINDEIPSSKEQGEYVDKRDYKDVDERDSDSDEKYYKDIDERRKYDDGDKRSRFIDARFNQDIDDIDNNIVQSEEQNDGLTFDDVELNEDKEVINEEDDVDKRNEEDDVDEINKEDDVDESNEDDDSGTVDNWNEIMGRRRTNRH